jgi:hypothetical protein
MVKSKSLPRSRFHDIWPDLLCLAAIAVYWLMAIGPVIIDEGRRGSDISRDAAAAMNILNGRWLADPAYIGEGIWYPPLSPMWVAGVSALTGIAPIDVYRRSAFWANWLIPVGLFLLVRRVWGRWAAILSTTAVLLAIPWWQMEVHLGQASIQSVIGGWIALWLYALQSLRRSTTWAIACGLFQGLAFWHHPFVPAVLAGAFILESLWESWRLRRDSASRGPRRDMLRRNAIIFAITFITAAPVLYMMMHGPVLNAVPREYFAPELKTREFALMNANPWIWVTGLIGLIFCFRQRCLACRILLGALLLTLLGQVPGYLRWWAPTGAARLPVIVPHEFQVLFQLGWAILVGIGAVELFRLARARFSWVQTSPASAPLFIGAALLITALPGMIHIKDNVRRFMHPIDPPEPFKELAGWIRAHTDINDVFACDPKLAFYWLGAETGRKVWLSTSGHSNPRVNCEARSVVLKEMADTHSPKRFWELMQQNEIDYCIPLRNWSPIIFRDEKLRSEAIPRYLTLAYAAKGVGILKRSTSPQ